MLLERPIGDTAGSKIRGNKSGKVKESPLREMTMDWQGYLEGKEDEEEISAIRKHARTGRPWGPEKWVSGLEES